MASSPGPTSGADARLHRIIHDAKFEIEEIQRRHRQNEADADNLDKEMDKLRVEGERIESEVGQLRAQTAQYEAEFERVTRLLASAEEEKKNLEATLQRKLKALEEYDKRAEKEDEEHRELMRSWRVK